MIVLYLTVYCLECTFRIYILLYIKIYYFIHFCCLLLKSWKACIVSFNKTLKLSANNYCANKFHKKVWKCQNNRTILNAQNWWNLKQSKTKLQVSVWMIPEFYLKLGLLPHNIYEIWIMFSCLYYFLFSLISHLS